MFCNRLILDEWSWNFSRNFKTNGRKKKKTNQMLRPLKQYGLATTIQRDLKTVSFLDITYDLQNNVYKPCRKANKKPVYKNKNSNHPASILK